MVLSAKLTQNNAVNRWLQDLRLMSENECLCVLQAKSLSSKNVIKVCFSLLLKFLNSKLYDGLFKNQQKLSQQTMKQSNKHEEEKVFTNNTIKKSSLKQSTTVREVNHFGKTIFFKVVTIADNQTDQFTFKRTFGHNLVQKGAHKRRDRQTLPVIIQFIHFIKDHYIYIILLYYPK